MSNSDLIYNHPVLKVCVPSEADDMILQKYLLSSLHFTKAQLRQMKFMPGGIRVNGAQVRVNAVLHQGDQLELPMREAGENDVVLDDFDYVPSILYEDEDLIAVWKPAGMPVHPSGAHYRETLSNAVQTYLRKKGRAVTVRSIGRLDADTSGIVVFACNQVAAARLWKQKEDGIFTKEYLALCQGILPSDGQWHTIERPIGKYPDDSIRMCVTEEGKMAVTHYRVLDADHGRIGNLRHYFSFDASQNTLVQVRIDTGRTHQIRVHMASIHHPLCGDPLYGTGHPGTDHAMLCAWKAQLVQPFHHNLIRLYSE